MVPWNQLYRLEKYGVIGSRRFTRSITINEISRPTFEYTQLYIYHQRCQGTGIIFELFTVEKYEFDKRFVLFSFQELKIIGLKVVQKSIDKTSMTTCIIVYKSFYYFISTLFMLELISLEFIVPTF